MCRQARGSIESYGIMHKNEGGNIDEIKNDLLKEIREIISNIVGEEESQKESM
jgi:hypothetical protein